MTSKVETTTATSTRTSSRKFFRRTVFRRAFAPKAAYTEIVDETPTAHHKKPQSFPKSLACFRRKPASCEASLIAESDTDEDSKAPRKAYVDRITVESPRVQPPLKPCLKTPTLERPISLEMDDGTLSGNSIMVDEDADRYVGQQCSHTATTFIVAQQAYPHLFLSRFVTVLSLPLLHWKDGVRA